jgi:hypothetical protein
VLAEFKVLLAVLEKIVIFRYCFVFLGGIDDEVCVGINWEWLFVARRDFPPIVAVTVNGR